jgi:hypothetical protein
MLDQIAKRQCLVVGQIALVEVGLYGAGDGLQIKLGRNTLDALEVPT